MITFFTCPKPFEGKIGIIQRNAIRSWKKSFPQSQIILFGNEKGIKEISSELGAVYFPDIKRSESGRPFLDQAFSKARELSENSIIAYSNSDIILTKDILKAAEKISFPQYLIAGRRHDLEIKEEINFNNNWEQELREKVSKQGKLHSYSGIDYLVFPKSFDPQLLPFPVGIVGWDNWLLYNTQKRGIPVIDATEAILAIHQNHDYSSSPFANEKKGRVEGPEMKRSIQLAGGFSNMISIRESDWILTKHGLKKPGLERRIFSFPLIKKALSFKRMIQNYERI